MGRLRYLLSNSQAIKHTGDLKLIQGLGFIPIDTKDNRDTI